MNAYYQASSYRPAVDAAHRAADGMCLLCRDVHRDVRLQDARGQAESPWQMDEETYKEVIVLGWMCWKKCGLCMWHKRLYYLSWLYCPLTEDFNSFSNKL